MTSVGAGRDIDAARRLRVVERLGLRIAFVGFSDINPAGFGAGPGNPGTVFATPELSAGTLGGRRGAPTWSSPPSTGASSGPRAPTRVSAPSP